MKVRANIVVGVCGGISCYKTAYLVRLLSKSNFAVKVIMTEAAAEFVRPLVFRNLSNNPVYCDLFATNNNNGGREHISLARWADFCVIAPTSANTLAKIAHGMCDNLLTTFILALPLQVRILLAPAMNENMWRKTVTQTNLKQIKSQDQFKIIGPESGDLCCQQQGQGRMASVDAIFSKIKALVDSKE
jgi:phosphopantothenoylcysteine decarboxylase/phosphopantothenate--cysteine ligase